MTTKVYQIAYLTAYTPQGTMEYRTTSYEELYKFKHVCKEYEIPHAVRFRNIKPKAEHVVYSNKIVTAVKNFVHWFALR